MAGPWEKYKPAETGGPWQKFQAQAPAQQPETTGEMLRRELSPKSLASAALRPVVQGATAIPGIFADSAMSLWNMATGQNNQLPSQATAQLLDRYTTKPEGIGRAAEFVSSALVGSRIPVPQVGRSVPENFRPTPTVREQTLAASQREGYVVPPSTVKPTVSRRLMETLGGKDGTAQDASIRNADVTDRLARRAFGLGEDAPLTRETLATIRQQAAPAYDAIRTVGRLNADSQYKNQLGAVVQRFRGAAKDFPGLAKNDIDDVVKEVQKDAFDADSAVDAIAILRDRASAAYAKGDKGMGKAYRSISDAMESLIERNLTNMGDDGAAMLREFRQARQTIAKTYSLEGAINESTGRVAAQKLAKQLERGKPLTGELRTIAQFGQAFPRAAREVVDSGSVRNTDAIVSGVTTGLSGQPWYLLYPFARMGARNALLSPTVQNSLVAQPQAINPAWIGASAPAYNELADLLR